MISRSMFQERNKKRLPQQARPPHPQRRLRMGIIVSKGWYGFHIAAIIQHFSSCSYITTLCLRNMLEAWYMFPTKILVVNIASRTAGIILDIHEHKYNMGYTL